MKINHLASKVILSLFLICAMQFTLHAQDASSAGGVSLEETLQALSEDAARSYLNPISSAYGSDLNAGWFHLAPDPEILGFDLEAGFVAMGTMFSDDNKSFSTSGSFRFGRDEAEHMTADLNLTPEIKTALINEIISSDYEVEISGATIIGSSTDSIIIALKNPTVSFTDPTGTEHTVELTTDNTTLPIAGFKELADIKFMPLMAPQVSIGTVLGTQATLRYLPTTRLNDDLGDFEYLGFGLQHNPAVWLPIDLPINVALSFYTQNLKIGELFKTTATAYGLNASKEIGWAGLNITPYGGFMYESSEMQVTYDMVYDKPDGTTGTIPIDFKMEGENKTRITTGLSVRFLLINVNADYNWGIYNSFSAGVNIRF